MPIANLNRTIFKISGDGAAAWLEGLLTNSFHPPLTFAALLTPQGKIIADLFVWQSGGLYIETPAKFGEALFKPLKMYRLRAPIVIEDVSAEMQVYALWGEDVAHGSVDPRHAKAGRMLCAANKTPPSDLVSDVAWNMHRLSLNLPDSHWDFGTGETFPANANMDKLAGLDFQKGCYVGQEVVSRMHRKTEVRKRMAAFEVSDNIEGDKLLLGERVVGEIMHMQGRLGMAMVRFDRLPRGHGPLTLGGSDVFLIADTASSSFE